MKCIIIAFGCITLYPLYLCTLCVIHYFVY